MIQITHLIASLEGGGAEKQALMILTESKKRNIDTTLIAFSLSKESKRKLDELNIIYHIVGKSIPVALFRVLRILIKNKPNIVSTWLTHMDLIGGLSSKLLSIKWVINERSSANAYSFKEGYSAINPILVRLRNFLGMYSDFIIANSLPGKTFWKDYLLHENVAYVPNIIDIYKKSEAGREALKDPLQKPYIIAVGSLIQSKNYISLIDAVEIVNKKNKLYLYILGEGPLEVLLKTHVKNLDLVQKVIFLGKVNGWRALLSESEGLIHPSLYEGMPNVVLETIAQKCPLLVSRIDSHVAILKDEEALFFDPLDKNDIANKILELLNNPDQSTERSQIAYNSLKNFHPDKILDSLTEVYRKIIQ